MSSYHVQILPSLAHISQQDWNACCFNDRTHHNPFLSHQFLYALEQSGCAVAETGWQAQHILIHKGASLVGIMPLYLKSHSQGEYVFDHAWANAYHNAGGDYYPKLQCSAPFSPVTGPRLMVRPSEDTPLIQKMLLDAAVNLAQKYGVSSLHVTFAEKSEWEFMADYGFLKRIDQQFHWLNENYRSFEDFLNALSSRKRKNIRKERKLAIINDIKIEILTGSQITENHWDHYFTFYIDTSNRKWGQPYLNRDFFTRLGEKMGDRTVLIMCKRGDKYIAGALNLFSDDTLYGRYWGANEQHRFLHFEVCYYQAIEYAIEKGLKKVEAGAQGEHKLSRGYRPTTTYSAHWINNPSFRDAIEGYLIRERDMSQQDQDMLASFTPFKRDKV